MFIPFLRQIRRHDFCKILKTWHILLPAFQFGSNILRRQTSGRQIGLGHAPSQGPVEGRLGAAI